MNRELPTSETEMRSRRTQLLRQSAMLRITLFNEFIQTRSDYDPDSDTGMTEEQIVAWEKFSAESLARIATELDKLE